MFRVFTHSVTRSLGTSHKDATWDTGKREITLIDTEVELNVLEQIEKERLVVSALCFDQQ